MENGGPLIVLPKECRKIGRVQEGVSRSDGRGTVSSKYSLDLDDDLLSRDEMRDLLKRFGKSKDETAFKKKKRRKRKIRVFIFLWWENWKGRLTETNSKL